LLGLNPSTLTYIVNRLNWRAVDVVVSNIDKLRGSAN